MKAKKQEIIITKEAQENIDFLCKYFCMPLQGELIPRGQWNNNLRSMLSPKDWDIIRRDAYKNAEYKCEICGGIGTKHPVEAHEVWDYNKETRVQKLIGIQALCPLCHNVKHLGLRGGFPGTSEHIMKVNNISEEECMKFKRIAFDIWRTLSKIEWTIDVSFIKDKYSIEPKLKHITE